MDLKQAAISICMMLFVVSSMIGMGLGLRISDIVAPLRNWRLVVPALVANFVVMPFVALALARILRLDESMAIGLLLLGMAGGAPFLPKLAQISKGNLAFAVGLMVLLMVITVGYLPLVLPLLLPGVSVNPAQIARSLVLLMLLPLGGALAIKANRPDLAGTIKPMFDKASNLSLIALMTLQTLFNIRSVIAVFGTGGILAGVAFLAVGFAIGWALGGSTRETRSVMGLGTAQRNIAAALVVANQSFDNPNVVVMVVVIALVGLLTLMPLARALGRAVSARKLPRPVHSS
jgi:BASS family bile acid:Na+ symporter